MVFVVEKDQCGGDDVADAPWTASPAAERLEGGLEQAVGALAERSQGAVDGVVGLLVDGQGTAGGLLDRDTQDVGLAFVAQVVWVPRTLSRHATCMYSCMRPPSRFRRSGRMAAPEDGGVAPAGGR